MEAESDNPLVSGAITSMSDYNTLNSTMSTSGNRRRRTLLLAGMTGGTLIILLVFLFRDRLPWFGGDDAGNGFPPGVLADYVPEDSEAVVGVNVRSLRESPVARFHLVPSWKQLMRQTGPRLRWIELLGINTLDDLDTIQISFAPKDGSQPLWLLGGRLDRARFQIGPDKLSETTLDRFRVWEYTDDTAKRTTLLAPVGDMLVVGETERRVRAALNPQAIAVRNAKLRELLAKVDRRQTLWLAVSIESLGPLGDLKEFSIIRPLLGHAESIRGGITCAEDVRADFAFGTATDEDAARMEASLKSICEIAAVPGAALLLGLGRQKELLPLLRLLAAGKIEREGRTVWLRSRLTGDQLEK